MKTINLVCRSESGRELSHQGFAPEDSARAERIMIARNRAELKAGSTHRWGIETETPLVTIHDPRYAPMPHFSNLP